MAWLIEDANGHLTTCPSESTENNFMAPDGKPAMTSAGCTMDMALIRELFTNCIHTTKELGIDEDFAANLDAARARLIPYQVGKYGQLQEWSVDFVESTPGQRHMSHIYPLYPGSEITPRGTPELARAARISLERRLANGGAYTGWSRAWAIAFWSRLGDGDKAWESLNMLMQHSTNINLFDTHPAGKTSIFQIDGKLRCDRSDRRDAAAKSFRQHRFAACVARCIATRCSHWASRKRQFRRRFGVVRQHGATMHTVP